MRILSPKIDQLLEIGEAWRDLRIKERALSYYKSLGVDPTDLALGGAGVAIAGISMVFAAVMILEPHDPYIPGIQYLAIFAMPNGSAARAPRQAQPAPSAAPSAPARVDYSPTASISAEKRLHNAVAFSKPAPGYLMLKARPELLWLQKGFDINEVRKHGSVPSFARIAATGIETNRWKVVNESRQVGPSVAPQPPSQKKFDKPLIFGGAPAPNRPVTP